MTKGFLRRGSGRHLKLGKRRKKNQSWKRPKGRDNKMREKRKGYPKVVSVGYKSEKKKRNTLMGKMPLIIMNIQDLNKIKKENIAVLGSVGRKRKIEIAKKAKEMKIEFYNLNPENFLKKSEKQVIKREGVKK